MDRKEPTPLVEAGTEQIILGFLDNHRFLRAEIKHRPYKVRGKTQYAKRYAKAQADFSRRYGNDTAKWPKGKAAETAIADFYKAIFG